MYHFVIIYLRHFSFLFFIRTNHKNFKRQKLRTYKTSKTLNAKNAYEYTEQKAEIFRIANLTDIYTGLLLDNKERFQNN